MKMFVYLGYAIPGSVSMLILTEVGDGGVSVYIVLLEA